MMLGVTDARSGSLSRGLIARAALGLFGATADMERSRTCSVIEGAVTDVTDISAK
jgi:hypothetical protein